MGFFKDLIIAFRTGGHDSGGWDRQNQNWAPVNGTGEQVNTISRDIIRARARDLERNADNVGAVIEAYERNVVGNGILLQAKIKDSEDEDSEENDRLNNVIEALWEEWCEAENCDITGQFEFHEIQNMAVRRRLVDGGLFVISTYDYSQHFPLKLQMKEVDELDTSILSYTFRGATNKVVSGIELNRYGKPIAYHFKEYDTYGWTGKSIRIAADHAKFINYKTRPSDIRELSPLSKILTRLKDVNQYMEAVSVKERVMACLAVFIKKVNGGGVSFGNPKAEQIDTGTGYKAKRLSPGMIERLDAGDDIEVVNPSGQASNAKDFIMTMLRSMSSAIGLSYEAVSRDLSQVNYSSARQNLLEDRGTYQLWQKYIIKHLCVPVYKEFVTTCVLSGLLDIPDFFTNKRKYTACAFIAKGLSWIDPIKEVKANEIAINSNQTTLAEVCAERGRDYKDVLKQRAKEKKLIEKYGLKGEAENGKTQANNRKPANAAND